MILVPNVASLRHLSGAQFSPCRTWRYALWRTWDVESGHVMFIGLNPSTADEQRDDPTIRRCIGFAKAWGYGGIHMLNLFAFRATDPGDMKRADDPVGPQNDDFLRMYAESSGRVIAAWGVHGAFQQRDWLVSLLNREPGAKTRTLGEILDCLGTTKDGHPRHPLYLPKTATPQPFNIKAG